MEGVDRLQACEQGRVASSPLPSMGTWGLIAPGGLRDPGPRTPLAPGSPARPARPASDPTRAPTGRPPSPRGAAWLAPPPGGEGKLGRVPPRPPRGPQSPRKAASNRRPRAPGRPITRYCLRGPRRALPARPAARLRAPEPGEGRRPARHDGAGHFCDPQLLRGIRAG